MRAGAMRAARGRLLAALAGAASVAALAVPSAQGAAAAWRLEQPAPPAGARFKVPLGAPGDLEFYAPDRGLLSVEGNGAVARGLFFYDGQSWRQLSTVCGDSGDSSRIAWAGPDEFWTVTEPSQPRSGSGLGLCHFKNGVIVGSYSTPDQSPDPFRPMDAASCAGPNDCWFGGAGSQDPSGSRIGAFHLHWNGSTLTSVYTPQGRGVSDLVSFLGTFYESVFAGTQREDREDPVSLVTPEPEGARLIHVLSGGVWRNAPYVASRPEGVPPQGTELLAADASATDLWFGGGGAASGPDAPTGDSVSRPPLAVHLTAGFFQELALDPALFGAHDRFADIAAVPGTSDAWVADQPYADRGSASARARVALLHPDGAAVITTLPSAGSGRGAAARIAFTSPTNGWMVTTAGWLFHYTDGTVLPRNTDPAFANTITNRPNEASAQFIPDTPPPDDSQINAPPVQVVIKPHRPRVRRLPPLLTHVKVRRRGLTLVVSFTVTRRGSVQLVGYRKRRLVARTRVKQVRKGHSSLTLRLDRRHYPTRLKFIVHEASPRTPHRTAAP